MLTFKEFLKEEWRHVGFASGAIIGGALGTLSSNPAAVGLGAAAGGALGYRIGIDKDQMNSFNQIIKTKKKFGVDSKEHKKALTKYYDLLRR